MIDGHRKRRTFSSAKPATVGSPTQPTGTDGAITHYGEQAHTRAALEKESPQREWGVTDYFGASKLPIITTLPAATSDIHFAIGFGRGQIAVPLP